MAVLIRDGPSGSRSDGEALRMALGLEIADHEVTVVLLDAGVFYAKKPHDREPEWFPYLELLLQLGHRLLVGRESAARAGLEETDLLASVGVIDEASLSSELLKMHVAIGY